MGRTFVSVRQEINAISDRWAQVSRTRKKADQAAGRYTAEIAKKYGSECFMGCNGGLEGALFSALVEIRKQKEKEDDDMTDITDG